MNSPKLNPAEHLVETEAEDHAEETRYAVEHRGKEKHPEHKMDSERQQGSSKKEPEVPWQID